MLFSASGRVSAPPDGSRAHRADGTRALSYGKGTIEDSLGVRGLRKLGKKTRWRKNFELLVARFTSALLLDDVVIGGGNAKKLKELPPGCRLGDNAFAFLGGFRMWEPKTRRKPPLPTTSSRQGKGSETAATRTELTMEIGMIGLGRMGANMVGAFSGNSIYASFSTGRRKR